jgi:hypothetical protein
MSVTFVYAATFDDPAEAEAFRSSLLDDGIPASLIPVTELGQRDEGKVRLEVQQEWAADVHRLLEGRPGVVRAGDEDEEKGRLPVENLGPSWTCPYCRATVEHGRFTCPTCGCLRTSRPAPHSDVVGSTNVSDGSADGVAGPSAPFPTPPSGPGFHAPHVGLFEGENLPLADREMVSVLAVFVLMLILVFFAAWRAGVLCALPALLATVYAVGLFGRHVSGRSATAQGSRGRGCALMLAGVFLVNALLGLLALVLMCENLADLLR